MALAWQSEQKSKTRADILGAAAKLLRGKGMRGTSVAKLMREAGLTVGGFYAHFRSKEQLVLEAFQAMMRETSARIDALPKDRRARASLFFSYYLSREHRDAPESGCPILPLVYEAADSSASFRRKFSESLEKAFQDRVKQFQLPEGAEGRERALAIFASLLGAQLLARATRGTPLSDQVLEATLKSLLREAK